MNVPVAPLFALALACSWGAARAEVVVAFPNGDRFTDTGYSTVETHRTMEEIARHLRALGARYLPPDETLKVDVLDIDLAGRIRWSHRAAQEIRVLDGTADWPRMELRYSLERDGKVVRSGKDDVSDMHYLLHQPTTYANQALAYEKRMLDDWFRSRFQAR